MEGGQKMFQHLNFRKINAGNDNGGRRKDKWVVMMEGGGGDEICDHSVSIESSIDESTNSASSSSSDLIEEDDASSSSSSTSSSSSSNGPLYELSALMAQLPAVKRGLSKFYQGKSQSFTSLANVNNIEDLAKKVNTSYKMRMKSCKSYAAGLDGHNKSMISPKATISKKPSRGSPFLSSSGQKTSLVSCCRPASAISMHRNF
ncbi:hypothetical protein ACOSQ2_015502 [Xanthoceras sorbifolium]